MSPQTRPWGAFSELVGRTECRIREPSLHPHFSKGSGQGVRGVPLPSLYPPPKRRLTQRAADFASAARLSNSLSLLALEENG